MPTQVYKVRMYPEQKERLEKQALEMGIVYDRRGSISKVLQQLGDGHLFLTRKKPKE